MSEQDLLDLLDRLDNMPRPEGGSIVMHRATGGPREPMPGHHGIVLGGRRGTESVWGNRQGALAHAAGQLPRPDHVESIRLEDVRVVRRRPMPEWQRRMNEAMAPIIHAQRDRMREFMAENATRTHTQGRFGLLDEALRRAREREQDGGES